MKTQVPKNPRMFPLNVTTYLGNKKCGALKQYLEHHIGIWNLKRKENRIVKILERS